MKFYPYQQVLSNELDIVESNLEELTNLLDNHFKASDKYGEIEEALIKKQQYIMTEYVNVLKERIENYKTEINERKE